MQPRSGRTSSGVVVGSANPGRGRGASKPMRPRRRPSGPTPMSLPCLQRLPRLRIC